MKNRKLLVGLIITILLLLIGVAAFMWRSQNPDKNTTKHDSVAAVDTSNWPRYRVDKLGISLKVPQGYRPSQLASDYEVDAMFSNLSDQQITNAAKANRAIDLGPQGDDAGGKISIPIISILKIDAPSSGFPEQTVPFYSEKVDLEIDGHKTIVVNDGHVDGLITYVAYVKLADGFTKITYNSEDDYRLTFKDFIAIVSNVKL